ncbi:hypothetical protein ACHAW6_011477 [Cyclotella cf. meneghiniana]
MAKCVSNELIPFTTPVPSFTLKPRVEKDDCSVALLAPLFAPSSTTFGRGLRIRSSFDEKDGVPISSCRKTEPLGDASPAVATIEPPEWAVKACGEARLEPVGTTAATHSSIDLSAKACFKIGRSPSSDMRLMEPTSSRKHALIFHHPNGSCYVVDCGSAHGTFVDGVRVESPIPQQGGKDNKATAIPHRVRKGALIRFGGPDGPTFVLRSFPASLEGLVRELGGDKNRGSSFVPMARADGGSCSPLTSDKPAKGETPSFMPTLAPTTPRLSKAGSPCSPASALVALNTRLNALGGGASLSHGNRLLATRAASSFVAKSNEKEQIDFCLLGKRFRSDDYNYNSDGECCPETPTRLMKRFRSATFPLSPEPSFRGCLKVNDLTQDTLQTPLVSQESLSTLEAEILCKIESRRRVKFLDETEMFYPASVTPDLPGSFDEEHFATLQM